ncbi:CoA-acylating methylmalonate-semialdehyde dehydrogenase [Humidisolicoccus flavus]|uniref:CoA-acylating methylmalonate-semialdehyde dehydrogenase n=1 Tax=Humidisolicoccus flavus TaxID=3111414 RepID=UPI0032568567
MNTTGHWIDGAVVHGTEESRLQDICNPATGEVIGRLALAAPEDVTRAVESARAAFLEWSAQSLARRQTVLFAFRELLLRNERSLAELITREHGKLIDDAIGEIRRGVEIVEMACGMSEHLKGQYSDNSSNGIDITSYRQPLGVVAGITPFNFPVMVPLWMCPVAIATGNAFVLKPSEQDPSAALEIARLWKEAGLPDGVFTVLQGDRHTVDALIEHPDVAALSFVGSSAVAKHIHTKASALGKRVQALGSAKNHGVVMPDADLDFAAEHLVAASFGAAGQRCMALSVAVAVGDAGGGLIERIAARAKAIRVGNGADADVDMGPLINAAARDRVVEALGAAAASGAQIVVDGREVSETDTSGGYFVGPSLVDHVDPEMELYQQEVFGPVLAVVRVATLAEAIALVNSSRYGNGAAIFTNSGAAAREFHRSVSAGMVGVNVPIPVPAGQFSFGGWKDSLFGDQHMYGAEGVKFYTRAKVVTSRWPEALDAHEASFTLPTT